MRQFIVHWECKGDPRINRHGQPTEERLAREWVDCANKAFPTIHHWLVPYKESETAAAPSRERDIAEVPKGEGVSG